MRTTLAKKALSTAAPVVFSTLIVGGILGPALGSLAGALLGWTGLLATAVLLAGRLEGPATRVLFGARPLTGVEAAELRHALTIVSGVGLGPPLVDIRVTGRAGAPAAVATGRHTVVVSARVVRATRNQKVTHDEVAALLLHAALTCRAGLSRSDCAIAFWTIPWRIVARLRFRLPGPLRFAWQTRPVVFLAGAGQAISSDRPGGVELAAGVLALLGLTYAVPVWTRGWQRQIHAVQIRRRISRGFGAAYAQYLRRFPAGAYEENRIRHLEEMLGTPASGAVLRLVGA